MTKILIGRNDNYIRFINFETGNDLDPIAILQELQAGHLKLYIGTRAQPITTKMRAFGCRIEGRFEVVGFRNATEIYLGPVER